MNHVKKPFNLNEWLAVRGTTVFGSMWMFYAFFIWGILGMIPSFPEKFRTFVLLVSSAWIQLWALPLISVGSGVLGRKTEAQAKESHDAVMKELKLAMAARLAMADELAELRKLETVVLQVADQNQKMFIQMMAMAKKVDDTLGHVAVIREKVDPSTPKMVVRG